MIWWTLSDAALLAGDGTGTLLTGIDLLGSPEETKWPNFKYKHEPKLLLEENFSLITQLGDRLCLPEMVHTIPGLPEAPGKTLAQGKEMEGSLDLLLLLLWESVNLQQERRPYWEDKGLAVTECHGSRHNLSTGHSFQSVETADFSAGSFTAFTPHMRTQTMAKGSLGPSDLQALSFFCFFFSGCFTPPPSACVVVLSLEDSLKRRWSRMKDGFTEEWKNTLLWDLRVRVSHCVRALRGNEGSATRWWFFRSYLSQQGGAEGDGPVSRPGPPSW